MFIEAVIVFGLVFYLLVTTCIFLFIKIIFSYAN